MKLDEAKQILEDNGFVLDQLAELGVDVNNGIQDMEQTTAYEIDVNDPVCPCCGQKLHITNQDVQTDEFIGESTLNERWENKYLVDKVADVAYQLYQEELADVQPDVDSEGNITDEYLDRFNYYIRREGNVDWSLSVHPYNAPLFDPYAWKQQSQYVNTSLSTPYITIENIYLLTDYMNRAEMLNPAGNVRQISLSEIGYTSSFGEDAQLASIVYAYTMAKSNPYITSFIL